jgi:hypothetical protein
MNSKVIVLADDTTGAVVNVSENNPDYGYIRVSQVRTVVDDNGFLRRKQITALMPALVADLQEMKLFANQQLDGKIVVEESLEPFNTKAPQRDLKVAGETGIVCTLGGLPIYRRTKFTFDSNASDISVRHDNIEELRNAYAAQNNTQSAIAPNQDFSIKG